MLYLQVKTLWTLKVSGGLPLQTPQLPRGRNFNLHNLHLFFRFSTQYAVTQKTPPSYSTVMVRSLEPSNPSQMPPLTPFPILLLVSQVPNDLSSFFLKPNNTEKLVWKDISIKNYLHTLSLWETHHLTVSLC